MLDCIWFRPLELLCYYSIIMGRSYGAWISFDITLLQTGGSYGAWIQAYLPEFYPSLFRRSL
jgi:hypothetical protein